MLDPLTSLGLVTNIVQLVDFGMKLTEQGREIARAGTTTGHAHLNSLVQESTSLCDSITRETESNVGIDAKQLIKAALPPARSGQSTTEAKPGRLDSSPPTPRLESEQAVKDLAYRTRDAAHELELLLSGLTLSEARAPNQTRKRKRDVVAQVVKGVWKEKDVQELRERLRELHQELMLRMTFMQSEASSEVLRSLRTLSAEKERERAARLGALDRSIPDTVAKARALSMDNNSRGSIDTCVFTGLTSLSGQVRTITKCRHVLKSLVFDEIHSRQDAVAEAHADTFSWVMENEDLGFVDWARSKNGIFWITGKPGSGKSTLMKYLIQCKQTTQLLHTWAAGRSLVVASHYFWNAGTAMQKSHTGLLRTLLSQILAQCPEAVLRAIPVRFQSGPGLGTVPWTHAELCNALEVIGSEQDLGAKLCFFIDGLDEYHGEHLDLIESLQKLAQCPSVKLCLSSRPWNPFTRAYDQRVDGQLTMQDLTQRDIQTYVRDRMHSNALFQVLQRSDSEGCEALIEGIRKKAQGVFLWVYLVVRSLLRGLDNDDGLDILQRRLIEYPPTLDGYFLRMLRRTEKIYGPHSARIMLVALATEGPLPKCAPRFLEQEITAGDYATKMQIWGPEHRGHVEESESARRYLHARCGDLLEIGPDGITFLHRTARDFLGQRSINLALRRDAGVDFDVQLSIARFTLTYIKSSSHDGHTLGSLVRQLLAAERKVSRASLSEYAALLDNFDANGESIFSKGDGLPVAYFDPSGAMVDHGIVTYTDSVHSFEVCSALSRLRHIEGSDEVEIKWQYSGLVENEAEDMTMLFGRNVDDFVYSYPFL